MNINNQKYEIKVAAREDEPLLISFKLATIFNNENSSASEAERQKVSNYINETVSEYLSDYKLIIVDNNIAGAFLLREYGDGYLLDEIYLLEQYRGKGIGSSIIRNILTSNSLAIYLWVYKNNERAISLYKNLGFSIGSEDEKRLMMLHKTIDKSPKIR